MTVPSVLSEPGLGSGCAEIARRATTRERVIISRPYGSLRRFTFSHKGKSKDYSTNYPASHLKNKLADLIFKLSRHLKYLKLNSRTSFPLPMEIGPNIRASLAASLAGEARLDVGQPNVIGPSVPADRRRMAAMIIGAIDQQAANAGGAHLAEGDFLSGEFGHGPLKRAPGTKAIGL
jgi:hypothetical protein